LDRIEFRVRARFRHSIRRAGVGDGSRLLVAVSGGRDSTGLLRLCVAEAPARGWRLAVGHIDHALRADSREDAAWVRDLAASLALPFLGLRARAPGAGARGASPEEAARRLRRAGLRRLARRWDAAWIVLGHTRDDQAETVLLRLLRGSGLRGLAAMEEARHPWLRPLLAVSRADLGHVAERSGWGFREDPSNQDLRFLRNRVRLRFLPLVEAELEPGAVRALAATADTLRDARRFLGAATREAWHATLIEEAPDRIRLDRPRLASYHPAVSVEVLRHALCRLRGTASDLRRLPLGDLDRRMRSGRGGGSALPHGLRAAMDRREVVLVREVAGAREAAGARESGLVHPS
jgi:tRNA(Ile)-lysidine synthase